MAKERVQIEAPDGQTMWVTEEAADRLTSLPQAKQAELKQRSAKHKEELLEVLKKYYPRQD